MNKLVSLTTRTQNRPLFVPKVYKTVVEQTYRPPEWIIVNGNGERINTLIEVLKLQYSVQLNGIEISLINKKSSIGIEGASNSSLGHAHGLYITLLNDDDTLDVTCFSILVHYMEHEKFPSERSIICYTHDIFEKIEDNRIDFLASSLLALTLENIAIANLAIDNQLTVHSFLYEKEVLKNIGMYSVTLPILGDWKFNLRFIIAFYISIVPKFLVNYHIRKEGHHTNSAISQRRRNSRYGTVIRNYFARNKNQYGELPSTILNARGTKWLGQTIDTLTQAITKEAKLLLDLGNGITEESSLKLSMAQNDDPLIIFKELRADELQDAVQFITTLCYTHIFRDGMNICAKQILDDKMHLIQELKNDKLAIAKLMHYAEKLFKKV